MNRIVMLTELRAIKPETVHPAVLDDSEHMVLVDCGDPELAQLLIDNMREEGLEPERLTHIIVTHHDLDHMGGLSQFRDLFPGVNVMASPVQAGYICGERRWMRLREEDRRYLALPAAERNPEDRVRARQYLQFLPAEVDTFLYDGQLLPFCGGCRVIYTSWHMPEHISLYVPALKALITGDALGTFGGEPALLSHVDLCPEAAADGLENYQNWTLKQYTDTMAVRVAWGPAGLAEL